MAVFDLGRVLPLTDEAAAVRKFASLAEEACRWKGLPLRNEEHQGRRLLLWSDLEIRQAGRGVMVRVKAPRFDGWWHEPWPWAGCAGAILPMTDMRLQDRIDAQRLLQFSRAASACSQSPPSRCFSNRQASGTDSRHMSFCNLGRAAAATMDQTSPEVSFGALDCAGAVAGR
jgi:hypothetical protein